MDKTGPGIISRGSTMKANRQSDILQDHHIGPTSNSELQKDYGKSAKDRNSIVLQSGSNPNSGNMDSFISKNDEATA